MSSSGQKRGSAGTPDKTKNLKHFCFRFLAERWGFEPQNAFDTLHDFQSCALDQLSHLSTSFILPLGGCPWRSTIIPESRLFVKDFFEKNQTFLKMTKKRRKSLFHMDKKPAKRLTQTKNRAIVRAERAAVGRLVPRRRNIAIQLFNAAATTLNCISQICRLNVALIS
mgnify:CR=1 FL=1